MINGKLIGIGAAGWATALVMALLWRNAEKDVLAEIRACNIDELEQTIEVQQREFAEAERAHETALANERMLRLSAENARQGLTEAVTELETQASEQAGRITELEMEADLDEIPLYADCSIVYLPSSLLFAEDCHADGSGDGHDYRVCVGPSGLNELDSAFTNITVGDAHRLWRADRLALGRCNAKLEAISRLK